MLPFLTEPYWLHIAPTFYPYFLPPVRNIMYLGQASLIGPRVWSLSLGLEADRDQSTEKLTDQDRLLAGAEGTWMKNVLT